MEQPINLHAAQVYEITVKGEINGSWLTDCGEVDVQADQLAGGVRLRTAGAVGR